MAKTGHPNFVLEFTSQWRGKAHVWRSTGNHSGASFTTQADAISFLQSYYIVARACISGQDTTTYISGWKYYDGLQSMPLWEAVFANQAAATAAGFGLGGTVATPNQGIYYIGAANAGGVCGLETCTVLQAPVGLSSKGKPIFLRKYFHSVPAWIPTVGAPDVAPWNNAATAGANLGNGNLFGNRVIISASGKQGPWSGYTYYANHQMPRRRKKKGVVASQSFLQTLLNDAPQIAEALLSVG